MNQSEQIQFLNHQLLAEMPQYKRDAQRFPQSQAEQRRLLRSLMNLRPPMMLTKEFIKAQDALLASEREEKGIVHVNDLPCIAADNRLVLWQGDITRLDADAIVNAANSQMLGCFAPCHGCIDNATPY